MCAFRSCWHGYLNSQDLPFKPKYLVTFTVGISQKENINRAVKKVIFKESIYIWHYSYIPGSTVSSRLLPFSFFLATLNLSINAHMWWSYSLANYLIVFDLWLQFSRDFAILLFHYDGRVSEWDEFEWSKRAIHVSVRKQAKWCVEMLYYSSHVLVIKMMLNFLDYHDL